MRKVVFVFLFILLGISSLVAQKFHFKNFSLKEGLPQSEVSGIVQHQSGRLIINIESNGFVEFDGTRFKQRHYESNFENLFVHQIFKDRAENIWLCTSLGVYKYALGDMVFFEYPDILGRVNNVFDMQQGNGDEYYLCTQNGVIIFENEKFRRVRIDSTDSGGEEARVFAMVTCINNQHWLGTNRGLFKLSADSIYRSDEYDIPVDLKILSMGKDVDSNIWLGRTGGAHILKPNQVIERTDFIQDQSNSLIEINLRKDGSLLLGTSGDGLYIYDGHYYKQYTDNNGLSNNYIWCTSEDNEGNLWIGTSGGGMDKFSGERFTVFKKSDGLINNIVYSVIQDRKGNMWFGVVQGGISIFDGQSFTNYSEKDGLSHRTVRSIFEDIQGRIWIGTENGITLFENNQFKNLSKQIGVEGLVIFDINQDQNGDMWFVGKGERYFGDGGGAYHYDGIKTTRYSINEGLPDNNLYKVFEEADGSILFCTSSGISKLENGVLTNFNSENGLCPGVVVSVVADVKNNLWIGTLGGLVFYNREEFKCIKEIDGMNSETIYLLQMENDSVLWVGTANGLDKLNINDFYETGEITTSHFGEEDGFYGLECNQNASCIDLDGNIWFGTILSAIKYNPRQDRQVATVPITQITQVEVNGIEFEYILADGTKPIRHRLGSNLKNIAFEFVGISLSNPSDVSYQHQLIGYDDQWSTSSNNTRTNYTNLPAGDYEFLVQSEGKGALSNDQVASFSFKIVSPIWMRWWFIAMALLVLGSVLYTLYKGRTSQIRKEEKLKAEFDKQLAEVELKALRAQMNPHFLFNCLNSIKHFIIKNDAQSASDYLSKFSRLMRLTLDNSKSSKISLDREIDALKLYIHLEHMRFENKFDYQIDVDPDVPLDEIDVPPLILQPYVENAIWHGLMHKKERGKLNIHFMRKGSKLKCEIMDNGIGRKQAERLKSKTATKTKSMGMKITSDRITQNVINGERAQIEVIDLYNEDKSSNGTKVVLHFPVEIFD